MLASLVAAAAVGLGAYGAHGLEATLKSTQIETGEFPEKIENWKTAVDYQMFHCLALFVVGALSLYRPSKVAFVAGVVFCLGVVGFSGGLYVTVFELAPIHMIIPIGGLLLIIGWVLLAVGILLLRQPTAD